MSDNQQDKSLFGGTNHLNDSTQSSGQQGQQGQQGQSHGLFDSVNQLANNARQDVEEAHKPHGLFDEVSQLADNARRTVEQAHQQGGKSLSDVHTEQTTAPDATVASGPAAAAAHAGDAAANQAETGTPYGLYSGTTAASGTDQWIEGGPQPSSSEDDFQGTGGVGSAEYFQRLHEGHEAAGGDYTSDLRNPDDTQG